MSALTRERVEALVMSVEGAMETAAPVILDTTMDCARLALAVLDAEERGALVEAVDAMDFLAEYEDDGIPSQGAMIAAIRAALKGETT